MNTQNIIGKCELVTLSNGYNDALSVDSEGNLY